LPGGNPFLFLIINIITMAINKDSTILEVLQANPDAGAVFARFGMGCVGCAISRGETVSEAAAAHGIPLEELLSALGIPA
jgi:hybrid cluster-associated redox disulfide protein